MADASIRPQPLRSPRRLANPAWSRLTALLIGRKHTGKLAAVGSQACLGPNDASEPSAAESAVQAPAHSAFPLLNAYSASALDLEHRTRELDLDCGLHIGPVAVQALVGDVLQRLDPLARRADLALLRDVHSGCDGVCCADPLLLRRVVSHLVLRALSLERAPGHVRVMVALTAREAHILILSRTPETTLADHRAAAHRDLVAPQRLLQAMGGSLVLEPRRAGYLPLCIALPALAASTARRAA